MGDDAIESFLESFDSGSGGDSIPHARSAITCCCGSTSCYYLQRNQSALDGLETQVDTAARLGKALLVRHEAYIADSEKERRAMTAHVESLEIQKQKLEDENAATIKENRDLLDQLENLNNAVAESDTQVLNLQATLQSTQQELQRLSTLATRTQKLEQQLVDFEREQAAWQLSLDEKESSERSATRRWQQAERTLASLQEQIERIEREAKEEKERHVEVLGRMERRHTVQKELDSAADRLKGNAASNTAGAEGGGTSVVSHFVKDILQDNANLQMGVVELREMLQASNEEVESLRQLLSVHQPVTEIAEATQVETTPLSRPHLKEEMRRATASALHVHHHYHAPTTSTVPKSGSGTLRRPKKKRYSALTAGHLTPTSGSSTPRHSFAPGTPSTTAAILSQTAASLPRDIGGKRWSMASSQSFQSTHDFSNPDSPLSTNRTSSVFDRIFSDSGQESSRPTTPETEDPGSPTWAPVHLKHSSRSSYHSQRQSSSSHKNKPSLDSILDVSYETLRTLDQQETSEAVIPEEDEQEWENADYCSPEEDTLVTSPLSEELERVLSKPPTGRLRRAASHESVLSFAGMDVHTLKSRPSQLLTPFGARAFAPQALVSDATAHATRPAAMSRPTQSGASILSGMPRAQRQVSDSQQAKPGFGKKVGGWMFGRWGAAPLPSVSIVAAATAPKLDRTTSITSGSTDRSHDDATPKKPKHRPPGINQSGPIVGFAPSVRIEHPPIMKSFDPDALKTVLGD